MRININQNFIKHAYRPSAASEEAGSLPLYKKLLSAPGAILSRFNGMAIEGLCGPGMPYGMAVAEMVSRKDSGGDLAEGADPAGQPGADAVVEVASYAGGING